MASSIYSTIFNKKAPTIGLNKIKLEKQKNIVDEAYCAHKKWKKIRKSEFRQIRNWPKNYKKIKINNNFLSWNTYTNYSPGLLQDTLLFDNAWNICEK